MWTSFDATPLFFTGTTDENGQLTTNATLPEILGQLALRAIVVAVPPSPAKDMFGSAEITLTVSKPLMIQPAVSSAASPSRVPRLQ